MACPCFKRFHFSRKTIWNEDSRDVAPTCSEASFPSYLAVLASCVWENSTSTSYSEVAWFFLPFFQTPFSTFSVAFGEVKLALLIIAGLPFLPLDRSKLLWTQQHTMQMVQAANSWETIDGYRRWKKDDLRQFPVTPVCQPECSEDGKGGLTGYRQFSKCGLVQIYHHSYKVFTKMSLLRIHKDDACRTPLWAVVVICFEWNTKEAMRRTSVIFFAQKLVVKVNFLSKNSLWQISR